MKKILVFLLIILAIYFGVSFLIAKEIISPTARHIDVSADFIYKDYKDVSFRTEDNLLLKGWLLNPKSDKVAIFISGILDNRTSDGYHVTELSRELIEKGFAVLLFDLRARGESEGEIKLKDEFKDVIASVSFVKNQGYDLNKTVIIGYSSGAVSTIQSLKSIKDVRAVILDSTPLHFEKTLEDILVTERKLPRIFLPGVRTVMKTIYGFNAQDIKSIARPGPNQTFLILHATHDQSVPYTESKILLQKIGRQAKLVLFPKGSHIETYKKNPEMYREVVFGFLDDVIKE